MNERISDQALAVLRRAQIDGSRVRLAPVDASLERALYLEVNEVLERLGGKWKGGRERAHLFTWYDPAVMLPAVVEAGDMPPKNPTDFYPTPRPIVEQMLAWAADHLGYAVSPHHHGGPGLLLEPSAGVGGIADVVRELYPTLTVHCCEVLAPNRAVLQAKGHTLVGADFLAYDPECRYDVIVMNPPFKDYIAHVEHAFSLLRPGGKLVSVVPSGVRFRSDKATWDFYSRVLTYGACDDLPAEAFKESGTNVGTCLIEMVNESQAWRRERYNGFPSWHAWAAELYADQEPDFEQAKYRLFAKLDKGGWTDLFFVPLPACVEEVRKLYAPVIREYRRHGEHIDPTEADWQYLAQRVVNDWRYERDYEAHSAA